VTPQLAALALLAGALSIASPCVIPLLPAYVGALSASAAATGDRSTVRAALWFVAGFTMVFVALGAVASTVGQLFRGRVDVLTQVAGALLIVLGLRLVAGDRVRLAPARWTQVAGEGARRMPASTNLTLGAAVGVGWTPCIGPILASVLTLSASSATVYEGAALLVLYSAGLAVPFVAIAVGFDRSDRLVTFLRRRGRVLERGGGVILLLVGVGYLTGWWSTVFGGIQGWLARTGWPPL